MPAAERGCPAKQHLPKDEPQWHYGIELDKCIQSDEHYVGTMEGIIRTRDIKRRLESERYQVDNLCTVVGIPLQPRSQEADYHLFVLPNPPSDVR